MTDSQIASSGKPTLAFFFSPTSGPSRRVEAYLAQVLQRRRNHETFALRRINADESPNLVERFQVTTVPTLVVVEHRRVRGRLEGSFGARDIERLLDPWLNKPAAAAPAEPDDEPLSLTSSIYDRRGLNLPDGLSFERWHAIGRKIGLVADGSVWWLADWACHGEGVFGERLRVAVAATGLDAPTLREYAWVAGRFLRSRRRERLSFGHHAEVADLPEAEQDAWLDRAEERGWSQSELRAELRRDRASREPKLPHAQLELSVETAQLERWRAAAEAESLELTDWLSSVADEAVRPADPSVCAA